MAPGSCASHRQRIPVSCKFLSKTPESGLVKKTWTVYFILFTQQSELELEWDSPSAVRSLKLMEANCGLCRVPRGARSSSSASPRPTVPNDGTATIGFRHR